MVKVKNPNHPVKGSTTKVEPIKKIRDIKAIKQLLKDNPRNLCLFTLGINTNLRASDLVKIKVCQVKDVKEGQDFEIKEKKTGKIRRVTLNRDCCKAIKNWLDTSEVKDGDYLFTGQRGKITPNYVNNLVKKWCASINLTGNYGSHTLRKTWGYHQRVTFGVGIPELMVCFNHSTQRQTLDYLCVQDEEIRNVYLNCVG